MCQSFGRPSRLEYWHIGETKTRLRNSRPRRLKGENRLLITQPLVRRNVLTPFYRPRPRSTKQTEPAESAQQLAGEEGEEVGDDDGPEVAPRRAPTPLP